MSEALHNLQSQNEPVGWSDAPKRLHVVHSEPIYERINSYTWFRYKHYKALQGVETQGPIAIHPSPPPLSSAPLLYTHKSRGMVKCLGYMALQMEVSQRHARNALWSFPGIKQLHPVC